MSHIEYEPQPILQSDVKCFWTLEEEQDVYNQEEILPDSYVELVVNLGAPLALETERGAQVKLPRVFFKGLQTKPLRLQVTGDLCQIVAMRLYAWTALPLLDVRANLVETPVIPLDEAWQDLAWALQTAVRRSGSIEAVYVLQQYVMDRRHPAQADLTPIQAAAERLYATQGQAHVSELAAHSYLSVSQLERRFKQLTGMTPKTFARLVRFEAIRDRFVIDPSRSTADIAHDFGYADQAHFIHDFKAFTGRTPGELISQRQDAEFLQYP